MFSIFPISSHGNIAHKVVALLLIYHADLRPSLPKLLRNATANTLCATSHDSYFIFEVFHTLQFNVNTN